MATPVQPVRGANPDGTLSISGTFTSTPPSSATATSSNVTENASAVTILAANAARLGFALYNDSDSAVNVKCGTAPTATSFTIRLLPRDHWSTAMLGINYVGILTAIWDSTPGTAGHTEMRVTEFTA